LTIRSLELVMDEINVDSIPLWRLKFRVAFTLQATVSVTSALICVRLRSPQATRNENSFNSECGPDSRTTCIAGIFVQSSPSSPGSRAGFLRGFLVAWRDELLVLIGTSGK
jgi:hypothetical protein